jgi:uncharacterized protein (DUF849 family)
MSAPTEAPRATAVAVAPNGARRTKADHPALPLSPGELAREAAACLERGACMLHLHVRNADGRHLLDPDAYRDAIRAIRAEVGERLVLQITTEAVGIYRPEQQVDVVRAVRPEAASIALRELAPEPSDDDLLCDLLGWMSRERIAAQLILYDPADVARLVAMRDSARLPEGGWSALYVLGRYSSGQTARPDELLPFLQAGSGQDDWMVCAFGPQEAASVCAAALLGGDVRVGFENNLWRPDGGLASSNADLVEAAAKPLVALGHRLAGADELRARWHR